MKIKLLLILFTFSLSSFGQSSFKEGDYVFDIDYSLNVITKEVKKDWVKRITILKSENKVIYEYYDVPPLTYSVVSSKKNSNGSIEYKITAVQQIQELTIGKRKDLWSIILHSSCPEFVCSYSIRTTLKLD